MRPPVARALLLLLFLALGARGQVPGEYPHLVLVDADGLAVPAASGPFDNGNVFTAAAGSLFEVQLSYAAALSPNGNVRWALLLSLSPTPFPTNTIPPPLLTLPPFEVVFPSPATLDATGHGKISLLVPTGLFGFEAYAQALVEDLTSFPNLQLSNGTKIAVEPPPFNVRFSYLRAAPATGVPDLDGVSTEDIDGDALNTFIPLGSALPPLTHAEDIGLLPGFRFLPIVPNVPDAPINPHARPITSVTLAVDGTSTTSIQVADTSFFPPRGSLAIAFTNAPANGNLWLDKGAGVTAPSVEVVRYKSKTPTSFTALKRKQLGSTGTNTYPHIVGETVLGDFTFATTSGVGTRSRVGLDVTNADLPHLVIPAFTFDGGPDVGSLTMDLDLYLYESSPGTRQGFLVLDRTSHTWRLLGGTEISVSETRFWDPMVAITPDRRAFIACVRNLTGALWPSDADDLWAIRLDGLSWPASGSEAWKITYQLEANPTAGTNTVRSRRPYMPSVAVLGPDPDNYVAFLGLASKVRQSLLGNNAFPNDVFEGFYVREEVVVRDYIDWPLVPPGSAKSKPPEPRPYITAQFPLTGTGVAVARFDPQPLVTPDHQAMFVVAGAFATEEDAYRVRNVGITTGGESAKSITNLTGFTALGGTGTVQGTTRAFDLGGHGAGGGAALSPDGKRLALRRASTSRRDFIQVFRTSGVDFGSVKNVFQNPVNGQFQTGPPYVNDHVVTGLGWIDDDRVRFAMGRLPHDDPLRADTAAEPPGVDLFVYTVSANTMVNLTRTGGSPTDFGALGTIRPAAFFSSDDGEFLYLLRDGLISPGVTSLPAGSPVLNVLGLHLPTLEAFDVTGDELPGGSLVANLDLPAGELFSPAETAAGLRFVEAGGVQGGMLYFVPHVALDATATDHVVGFNRDAPFVAFQATTAAPAGSHVSNVTPNAFGSSLAFARTAGTDPFAATQHPFVVDLDNFLFVRDLTPQVVDANGPLGRVMDGSFHFLPPSGGAGDALIFAMGGAVVAGSEGIAQQTTSVYYPLANLSNTLAEPVALLLPILSTQGLGIGYRVYLTSAGLSTGD